MKHNYFVVTFPIGLNADRSVDYCLSELRHLFNALNEG